MKLINRDEFEKKIRTAIPQSSYQNQINVTPHMICDLADKCLLDPADLLALTKEAKELNMGYAWAWGKLNTIMRDWRKRDYNIGDLTGNTRGGTLDAVINTIADLESRLDAEGEKVLVKARAWGLVASNLTNIGLAWEVKKYLDLARAELGETK